MRGSLPDIIISDLAMPHMSGFELLSVIRRRFPHIPVIAISGQYDGNRPVGLLCDAYFVKAQYKPEDLFLKIGDLIKESPLRPHTGKSNYAPVWYPFSQTGYYVLTCTECLRSFSIPEELSSDHEVRESECVFCGTTVRYIVDSRPTQVKKRKQ